MIRLKNGDLITEEIKKAFKEKTTYAYLNVYSNNNYEYKLSYDDYLTKVEYYDDKCDPEDGKFIGKATTRQIDVEFKNVDSQFKIDGKEVEYVIGTILDNGETAEISYGNFVVSEFENKEIEETTTFTAYDYMSKTDVPYACGIKAFPVSLLDFAKDVCEQCGLKLGNSTFRNSNKKIINANPFLGGENCREVIKSIAKLSFTVAHINYDNRLYFEFDLKDTADEEITTDDYFELSPNTDLEPLNKVTLRSSEVTASGQSIGYKGNYSNDLYYLVGDIVNYNSEKYYCIQEGKGNLPTNSSYWEVYTNIVINDVKELIIEEDYFAYTDTLRNEFLKEAVNLYGLMYFPVEIDLLGSIYLQFNDVLQITNTKNENLKTYCFNNEHTYNGVLYNTITSPVLTEEEEKHTYQTEKDTFEARTYIEIDKANKNIEASIKELGDATSKYSTLKEQLDEIQAEIGSITDITVSAEGYGTVELDDINTSEPIYIKIHAQGEDITPLYPSNTLYPSNSLYPHNRELLFKNKTDDKTVVYNLPCNLYYLDEETYDEFVLDYENAMCYVTHRVEIIEGQKVKRTNEIIENFDYPLIPLTDGDYTISIPYCLSAYIYARLMSKNLYTKQYATKVELRSSLALTEESIMSEVSQEITPVRGEVQKLSSQIEQTIKSISLKVNNGETTAGIVITLEKEDGTEETLNGTINMTGLVNFSDLSGSGTTTINGSNIKTGVIDGERLNVTKLNATTGTIAGFTIDDTSLKATGISLGSDGTTIINTLLTEYNDDGEMYGNFIKTQRADTHGDTSVRKINIINTNEGVNIAGYVNNNFNLYAPISDVNLKENIQETKVRALDYINKIEHVEFNWKRDGEFQKNGYKAQQLEKICRDFVANVLQNDGTNLLQVRDFNMLPYITKSIQELYKENEELKSTVADLIKRIEILENRS